MPPWWRRLRCRLFGHAWVGEHRADPVIPLFIICRRCGKHDRLAIGDGIRRAVGPRDL